MRVGRKAGIAIEPQTHFAADYARFRPRTRFVAMFATDQPGNATLFVPSNNSLIASSTESFTAAGGETGTAHHVPATTLNVVLTRAGIQRIDFLSLDIELHEPQALAGFDIDKCRPSLVCIEAHPHVRQQILDYFHQHKYSVVGKYLRVDVTNLYFTPAASRP